MLRPGTRFGHFEVVSPLGEGGMGVVWRARDTTLGREVALKTLPDRLADDPERLTRLGREASLLASLNHPSIAAIHGLEEHDSVRCLVLELVEGETLDHVLARGPVPVARALTLARQLAEGVAAAHDKDVVHRDLKPANIKVTPDGRIKVLDFGVAKTLAPPSDSAATVTAEATERGVVLGTPAYMSPEQARGEAATVQADIWSFGVVFFEMLTGASPFKRHTTAETFASLLQTEPDFTALPPETPVSVRRLLRRCLQKDQRARLHHMGDVQLALEDAIGEPGAAGPVEVARSAGGGRQSAALAVVGVALLATGAGWAIARIGVGDVGRDVVRLTMRFVGRPSSFPFGSRHLAISTDGLRVAFTGGGRLWVRQMDRPEPVALHEFRETSNPFFSTDDQWIALFSESALVKVPVQGGAPVVIATTTDRPRGAVWLEDDTIVFATTEGLFRVPAGGGEPRLLKKPDRGQGELFYAWPQGVPGRQAVLLTIVSEGSQRAMRTALLDLTTLAHTVVLDDAASATYTATGRLVYASGSDLRAIAFDTNAGIVRGEPTTEPGIVVDTAPDNGAANFAVARNGTLVLTPPRLSAGARQLEWLDRSGREEPLSLEPKNDRYPRVSPDGSRIAVDRNRNGSRDIWIIDLERLTETQLTDGPTEDMLPVWSRDGTRVWFASDRGGNFDIYSQAADGASPARLELALPEAQVTQAFTPDGSRLLVYDRFRDTMLLPLASPGRLEPLLDHERFDQRLGQVSPDGKWIAYESDESGSRFEIFLRPFPDVSARREKVSVNGGRYPLWAPGGTELYYVGLDGAMMAVPVTLSPSIILGEAVKLFDWQQPGGRSGIPYDVSPKDGRFLVERAVGGSDANATDVSVVLNWLDTLP